MTDVGTDTAVLLLLADLQRTIESLRARVAELEAQRTTPDDGKRDRP